MRPVTRPTVQQPTVADESAIKSWLDALASGVCDTSAFLLSVRERFGSDSDGSWEVLSQLDQYYRRGRIKPEVFHAVRTALAESALGTRNANTLGIPLAGDVAAPRSPVRAEPAGIPLASDVAAPRSPVRAEPADPHPFREEIQPQDAVLELKPGSVLRRRYRIETMLGQGAMGIVFQALDEYRLETPPVGQHLAIKVLHTSVTKRAELLTELRRAFQQMQRLSHPNIVRVFEFDRDGPIVFFTMELLSGALLSRVLQARKFIPLDRAQALAVIRDIGAAISYAHSRGVVHGDINPQNVFITISGELRVLDFGASHKSNRTAAATDHELTLPFATSGYASCQVLEGERADARDDVFALACIAYVLLCGEHPFSKKTAIEARAARLIPRRPPKLTNQQWQALRAGLRWEREDRPVDVQRWLERLHLGGAAKHLAPAAELVEAPPPKERKSRFSMAVATAIVLLLAAGYWVIGQRGVLPSVDGGAPSVTPSASSPQKPPPSATTLPAESEPSFNDRSQAPTTRAAPPPPSARVAGASHDASAAREAAAAREASAARDAAAAREASAARDASAAREAPSMRAAPTTREAPSTTQRAPTAPPPAATAPPTVASAGVASGASAGVASGASRIELAADLVEVPAAESSAEVTVHRKGSLRGAANFTWWTESGTAKPGIDFSAVVPQPANVGDGKSGISLSIPVSKARRTQSKSFYVVIDRSEEGGAALGARTLTMVTLLPAD
jgi:serine/threonine protein kinase